MNNIRPFRFWCQKVLPLVYDDSLSYYELLCKVVAKLNEVITNENELNEAFQQLKDWIENWVDTQDFEKMIDDKLDEMVKDGTFNKLINQEIFGDLNTKVNNNTSDISSLTTRITTAENNIKSQGTRISNVETRVKNNRNKRIIMIADSYGEFGCMEYFADRLKAVVVTKKWVGGAGFTQKGDKQFLTILNSLPDNASVDYVVVFGFYNDAWQTGNLWGAVNTFRSRCEEKYPGAVLVLVNQGWSSNYELQGYFQALMREVETLCSIPGTIVIHTWKFLHNYVNMQSDKIHPTETASQLQGCLAANVLLGGDNKFMFPILSNTASIINGWEAWGAGLSIFEEMNESEVILYFTNNINHFGLHTGGTNIRCDGSNVIELMILQPSYIIGSGDIQETIPCVLQQLNGKYYEAMCTLEIQDRTLKVRPISLTDDGTNFRVLNLQSIQWGRVTLRGNIYHI